MTVCGFFLMDPPPPESGGSYMLVLNYEHPFSGKEIKYPPPPPPRELVIIILFFNTQHPLFQAFLEIFPRQSAPKVVSLLIDLRRIRLPGRRALVVVFIKNMLFEIIAFVVFECL